MHSVNRTRIVESLGMSPNAKKVIMITGISFGILFFSFLIPAVIFPSYRTAQKSASCMDFNCAGTQYQRCQDTGSSNSSGFFAMASNGIKGMACMMGIGQPASYLGYLYAIESHGTFKSKIAHSD